MIIQQPIITASISGDSVKTNISASYIGFNATASAGSVYNELVFGLDVTGSGTNTVTIGNTASIQTKLFGSIYQHQHINSDTVLEKYTMYTLSGSFTASLPPSPNAGDSIKIADFSLPVTGSERFGQLTSSQTILIGRNGENIMGHAEDMTLDYIWPTFEIMYTDSIRGWIVIGG